MIALRREFSGVNIRLSLQARKLELGRYQLENDPQLSGWILSCILGFSSLVDWASTWWNSNTC